VAVGWGAYTVYMIRRLDKIIRVVCLSLGVRIQYT